MKKLFVVFILGLSLNINILNAKVQNIQQNKGGFIETRQGDIKSYLEGIKYGKKGDNVWKSPSQYQLSIFEDAFINFVNGNIDSSNIKAHMIGCKVVKFIDFKTNNIYYIFKEIAKYGNSHYKGVGTYVLKNDNKKVFFTIEIPHPKYDAKTNLEGIEVFLNSKTKMLMLAGTRRDSSTNKSNCSGNYFASDVAHQTNSYFYVAHKVVSDFYDNSVFIQFHGFGTKTKNKLQKQCKTKNENLVNLSETIKYKKDSYTNKPFIDILNNIINNNKTIKSCLYGVDTKSLGGTTNVEGRYTNGSINSCQSPATSSSHRFIHIEQSSNVRSSYRTDMLNYINSAIEVYEQ